MTCDDGDVDITWAKSPRIKDLGFLVFGSISSSPHNVVAASFFPAQVSSIQLARDIEFSIFAEVERLV